MHLHLALDTDKMMGQLLDRKFETLKQNMILEGVRFLALDKKANSILVTVRTDQKEKLNNLLAKRFRTEGHREKEETQSVDLTILKKVLLRSR
jgi:hypothetical protein